MTRIAICGFYGWGNNGDEGILQAIMDSLGDNEYIVHTNLPFSMLADYATYLALSTKLPARVLDVRQIYDVRDDYDVFLLGGGALSWGFGWRQALVAFSSRKPSMNYGVGFNRHQLYHPQMNRLYNAFLEQFNAITVRDRFSQEIVENLGVGAILTACPSINLKEQPFDDCPKNMIAVCPRYEDYGTNDAQLNWLTERLQNVEDEVLLIPFAPDNTEGAIVDLSLCRELKRRLKHSQTLETDGFSPRKIKYAISQSKHVISGGRYHAIVWAAAHKVGFEVCPTAFDNYPKIGAFFSMYGNYGSEKLKEMERDNVKIFQRIWST